MTLSKFVNVHDLFGENIRPDYENFVSVLADAYKQTAGGKGNERHGGADRPWHDQPIMTELRQTGTPGFQLGQARKKLLESLRLYEESPERAYKEVLGAIVYAAAAAQFYRGDAEAGGPGTIPSPRGTK